MRQWPTDVHVDVDDDGADDDQEAICCRYTSCALAPANLKGGVEGSHNFLSRVNCSLIKILATYRRSSLVECH